MQKVLESPVKDFIGKKYNLTFIEKGYIIYGYQRVGGIGVFHIRLSYRSQNLTLEIVKIKNE